MAMTRRESIKALLLTGATIGVAGGGLSIGWRRSAGNDPEGDGSRRELDALKDIPPQDNEDILLTMQRDLVRAMKKPVEKRMWGMAIDRRKCVGCDACTIGCIAENKLPPGVVYRPVIKKETGRYPDQRIDFTPRPCMQCRSPSCVPVCPVNATWKRADGVTTMDYDKCIGCRKCLAACPYGARNSDFGHHYNDAVAAGAGDAPDRPLHGAVPSWEEQPSHEYGKHWSRAGHGSPVGNARKCHFCLHRLEVGQLPVCVTTCIGRATYFGDLNDDTAVITRLIHNERTEQLLPHTGNDPAVYYIG